ncbi:hypothetical protein [Cellulomonas hominis]|uniref:hypothetical protein n=1 Tax=Cellulomonas hominis TaxID=156981 RepID=UPI001B9145EA|nr:hypothetical protein [Cellulomonas hominis]VTR76121.1 hypothetical protein CHMI_00877 [Cellulomonas hominis]
MATFDIVDTEPRDGPDRRPRRRRRGRLAALAVGVPVLVVLVGLGVRAAGGTDADVDAAEPAVSSAARDLAGSGPEGGTYFGGGVLEAAGAMSGSSGTVPASGVLDLTVVCVSLGGRPAQVVVRVDDETVEEGTAACADASGAAVEPAVTVLPTVQAASAWSFEVVAGSRSAIAVVMH